MADLNLSPVEEIAEASCDSKMFGCRMSAHTCPWPPMCPLSTAGWRGIWEAPSNMGLISRECFCLFVLQEGQFFAWNFVWIQFMRNASLPGSWSQALAIFDVPDNAQEAAQQKRSSDFSLALLFFARAPRIPLPTVTWIGSDWKEALFPVNNLSLLNPDCHLPRTYLISHPSKYSISPAQW